MPKPCNTRSARCNSAAHPTSTAGITVDPGEAGAALVDFARQIAEMERDRVTEDFPNTWGAVEHGVTFPYPFGAGVPLLVDCGVGPPSRVQTMLAACQGRAASDGRPVVASVVTDDGRAYAVITYGTASQRVLDRSRAALVEKDADEIRSERQARRQTKRLAKRRDR